MGGRLGDGGLDPKFLRRRVIVTNTTFGNVSNRGLIERLRMRGIELGRLFTLEVRLFVLQHVLCGIYTN